MDCDANTNVDGHRPNPEHRLDAMATELLRNAGVDDTVDETLFDTLATSPAAGSSLLTLEQLPRAVPPPLLITPRDHRVD